MHPLQVACLCVLYNTAVQYLCFNPRISRSKWKSNSDAAGTAKKCQLLFCTTVLFKVLFCKIKNVLYFLFVMYFLCEKYCKPTIIIQYYTVDRVSWVLRLTSLDLMNKLDL